MGHEYKSRVIHAKGSQRFVDPYKPSVRFVRIVDAVYGPYTLRQMHLIKRLKREKISIKACCHNKQTTHACVPRSLSVSDNMTRLERKKLSESTDTATTNKPHMHVYFVL